jgi:arginyl-tRNA synthetase
MLAWESHLVQSHLFEQAMECIERSPVVYWAREGRYAGAFVIRTGEPAEDGEAKSEVLIRSNGIPTYVGKDIAYHMWKFGLLGKDFGYRRFHTYPNQHQCWISAEHGDPDHPHFGGVGRTYNVIDARQSEAQNAVIEALRGLGHGEYADKLKHFSYEMVALTPRCAAELGYELSDEDKERAYVEVSGRKGFGVKADDLIDKLIESAAKEVDSRHPELPEPERRDIAGKIAIGALRYFMLKYTKPSVIAFDFKEALSFEGETGPYAQYAVVRATNIFRKGGMNVENYSAYASVLNLPDPTSPNSGENWGTPFSDFLTDNDFWELWLTASKTAFVIDQCIAATEPAYLAKHVFQLAQMFNTFYHRYPILSEPDEKRKKFLLATAAVVRRELIRALAVMGIEVPPVM